MYFNHSFLVISIILLTSHLAPMLFSLLHWIVYLCSLAVPWTFLKQSFFVFCQVICIFCFCGIIEKLVFLGGGMLSWCFSLFFQFCFALLISDFTFTVQPGSLRLFLWMHPFHSSYSLLGTDSWDHIPPLQPAKPGYILRPSRVFS